MPNLLFSLSRANRWVLPLICLFTINTSLAKKPVKPQTQETTTTDLVEGPLTESTEGYNVGVHAGLAFPNKISNILKTGYSIGIQYGYHDTNYRSELALSFINHTIKSTASANYAMLTVMFNVYYDFNYDGIVVPFVGAGAGYLNGWVHNCSNQSTNCTRPNTGGKFAYQGIAGLGFNLGQHFRLDARYRYLTFSNRNSFSQNIAELVFSYLVS